MTRRPGLLWLVIHLAGLALNPPQSSAILSDPRAILVQSSGHVRPGAAGNTKIFVASLVASGGRILR